MNQTIIALAINGIVFGLIVALIALGLSIIFGLLDIINLSHGDFFMVGTVFAYTTLSVLGHFWPALIIAPLIGFALGALIQFSIIQRIKNNAALSIVATFGIEYECYRIFAAIASIIAIGSFFIFLKSTKLGVWMRAVRHDRDTATTMGIPTQKVYLFTFGIGFAMAAVGGVIAAPITTVDFRTGVDILPFCFMAVIIGGLGNLPGTVAAAVLLAFLEGVISGFATPTIARIFSLVLMSSVLLIRPQGLFKGLTK